MKKPTLLKRIIALSIVLFAFLLLVSCEKDLYENAVAGSDKVKYETVNIDNLLSEISDPNIINYLQTLKRDLSQSQSTGLERPTPYFSKNTLSPTSIPVII